MTFLGPTFTTLFAAGGAIAAGLVALYLLRPSRRRVVVPYARLWGLLAKEAQASALARRLRRWESLLVQLVIAALLLLAISDPHLGEKTQRPRHVVLVDTSASMAAHDGASTPSRLDSAKRAAQRVLDELSPDEEAMIVGFDSSPHVLAPLTTDEATLRAAVDALHASDAPDAIVPALRLAGDALAGAGRKRITLISDGAIDELALANTAVGVEPGALPLADVDVRFEPVAPLSPPGETPSDNLAITAFSVRRYPANPSAYEILVEVRSYSDRPRHARLTITQEQDPVEITELDLPPHARVQKILSDLAGEGVALEATIAAADFDPLALDDHAYAFLPERRRTKVQLIGNGDLYTEGALLLDRGVEVEKRTPAQYDPEKTKSADALVFVGFTPPTPAPRPALYLSCEGPGCPFTGHGTVNDPVLTETNKTHPVMKWVALKDLNAVRTTTFTLQSGDVALASTLGRPFFVAGSRNGVPAVALGFAPASSDLPLRIAFPVLLVNSLKWLSGKSLDPVDSVLTGRAGRLIATHDPLTLTSPDGGTIALPVRDGAAWLTANQVGLYRAPDEKRVIAANLFDARESSISGHPILLAGHALERPSFSEHLRPRASLWRWLALLALVLLVLEWWTYHRRWTV
jgi:hypothetical protein